MTRRDECNRLSMDKKKNERFLTLSSSFVFNDDNDRSFCSLLSSVFHLMSITVKRKRETKKGRLKNECYCWH